MSVANVLGKRMPVCGGGYLRYLPCSSAKKAFIDVLKDKTAILYMHPYELDTKRYPDYFYQAKAKLPFKKRIPLSLYRFKKASVRGKLIKFFSEFRFEPLYKIIQEIKATKKLPATIIK